jgi:hypothetical protein
MEEKPAKSFLVICAAFLLLLQKLQWDVCLATSAAVTVELHASQQRKNIECFTTMLLWRISVAGNNRKSFGLHVKCQIFLSDFNQIWIFMTDIRLCPEYQILPKSTQ